MKAARLGDSTKGSFTASWCSHPTKTGKKHPGGPVSGTIKSGSPNVFVNGKPAARVGDTVYETCSCRNGNGKISQGSSTVFVNGKPKARLSDKVNEHTDRDGKITSSSNNVFVG